MIHEKSCTTWFRGAAVFLAGFSGLLFVEYSSPLLAALGQGEIDVSPEATPQIQQVKPNQAAAGEEVTVRIEGRSFSRGAYVSFSNPAVHVLSTRRESATQLEAEVAIGKKARPETVSLYVSNPAGSVAEAAFTIAGGTAQPAGPAAPAAPVVEIQPSTLGTPEVAAVDPPRVTRGSQASVKVSGKNFDKGTKISFSNPGIRVLEISLPKSTELTARIQVASDAPVGTTSLYVVNPDDREAEVPFEVAEGSPAQPAAPAATSESAVSAAQRFEVMNLGEGISIFQNPNKPKGTLSLAAGKLKYEEAGKEVFSAAQADIKEIDVNSILGVNTGTFHVILRTGQTFNFVAASLRPADSQSVVDALRRAMK